MLERRFRLSERGSDVRTEVAAGIPFGGAVTAICLGAALATLIMATLGDFTQPYVIVALFSLVTRAVPRAWNVRGGLLRGILLATALAPVFAATFANHWINGFLR